jgi:glycerol-3-phosphate dehydrogenase
VARAANADAPVAVVGGGVVGVAVAYALAGRGVGAIVLEAQDELGLAASGTNSGILHMGFDSAPGELETRLIVRAAALREGVLAGLDVPVLRCGALVRPRDEGDGAKVAALAANARANDVPVALGDDGVLEVPGEAVTDPVAYTLALAAAAVGGGADVRTGARVEAIRRAAGRLVVSVAGGDEVIADAAVNCAGLHADAVARMAGDDGFEIYPRKGEFFVFDPPDGRRLERILLPVPTKRTKGVLVFPTVDGQIVAGPTAHDQVDKSDWSVRDEARDEVLPKARAMLPALEGAEPVAAYAGLRPAGRDVNYLIGPSPACPELFNVAAIRSTGLTASLAIGEHVAELLGQRGVALAPPRLLAPRPFTADDAPWWRRTAQHVAGVA